MIHLQLNTQGWNEALSRLPDGALIKLVDMVQTAAEVKATNPKLKVLLRHVNNTGYVWSLDWQANVAQAELEYRTYIDGTFAQYAHLVDYVEEPRNEYVDDGMDSNTVAMRVMWARACAYVWKTVFQPQWPHIMVLIGSQPVGNHIPLGFAQAAKEFGAGISTHAYIHYVGPGQRDPLDFQFHSGRWNDDDALFRANGIRVPMAITETGPYGSTDAGWRDPAILDGNVAAYVAAVRDWIRDVRGTVAYQEGRILGFNLFTTIGGNDWPYYQTNQPELNALADMVKVEWTQASPPPPPPPDPCQPRVAYQREYWAVPQDASPDQFATLARLAHTNRRTIGYSYDDSMFGPNLTSRKAVLFGIPASQQSSFIAFRDEHYPGAVLEFRDMPGPLFDWPIGTEAERASALNGLPGNWIDANPYGTRYQFGDPLQWARHTGADLNLNLPVANSDANSPVLAVAPGVVLFASLVSDSTWGRLVVLRHEVDGVVFHSRYAHLRILTVTPGQVVATGQQIGTIGGVEYGVATHLHWDISHSGVLQANPIHWPGDNLPLVQQHYLPPIPFLVARKV